MIRDQKYSNKMYFMNMIFRSMCIPPRPVLGLLPINLTITCISCCFTSISNFRQFRFSSISKLALISNFLQFSYIIESALKVIKSIISQALKYYLKVLNTQYQLNKKYFCSLMIVRICTSTILMHDG